jgi:N-acetylglucosamine kinase-like BadF-type ATPase/DNA-binding Xre family transcriptional regulator
VNRLDKERIAKRIAENVAVMLRARSMTNAELAKKSDVTRSTVGKILAAEINISAMMLVKLARGLDVQPNDILNGLVDDTQPFVQEELSKDQVLYAGILSINKKRMTCIKDHQGEVVGLSELDSDLDLAETLPHVFKLIETSITQALKDTAYQSIDLSAINLLVVVQSYEFMQTRKKFEDYAKRFFYSIKLIPDWQITYLSAFGQKAGICMVVDKGVSLSYLHDQRLQKIWGWKFPIYDVGGENWLGVQAIRHTVDAEGGFVPMTDLARAILTKHGGLIENILESCFKKEKDPDVYCLFSDILLRCYFRGDAKAKTIIEDGFNSVYRAIDRIDQITKKPLQIAIHGSLADIYKTFIDPARLSESSANQDKANLLADVAADISKNKDQSIYSGIIF